MNMREWRSNVIANPVKKGMPVLSFPATKLLGVNVLTMLRDSDLQAKGMKLIADRCDAGIAAGMMDLSVEAEAFGCSVTFPEDNVPRSEAMGVADLDAAAQLEAHVGYGRTGLYVEGIAKAKKLITDRPVLANVIGPYSLAGNVMEVTKFMKACMKKKDLAHAVVDKCTQFLIEYALAYKEAGADGIVFAEPLPGLVSPDMNREFSITYCKRIIDAVQDDHFSVVYHNCGQNAGMFLGDLTGLGCHAYHFSNKTDMSVFLAGLPKEALVMGNIDPADEFNFGTPESMRAAVLNMLSKFGPENPNYIVSSGCDIPAGSDWANIDAFFAAVKEYYGA